MRRLILGIAIVGMWTAAASAQEPLFVSGGSVQVEDRLRATYLPHRSAEDWKDTATGEYAGLGPGVLKLSTQLPSGELVREVDLDEILRLERARPRTIGEGVGQGVRWGAVAGAVFGLALLATGCSGDVYCVGSDYFIVPTLFTGIGAGAGAAIGMAVRGTTWEEIALPQSR